MKGSSLFDIAGPAMVGPSSSHTAGAVRIGNLCHMLAESPVAEARFTLYNSFAQTYRGHGTDRGLLAGVMGFPVHDSRIKEAFALAKAQNLRYDMIPFSGANNYPPNTVMIDLVLRDQSTLKVVGHSTGGGRVYISQINHLSVSLRGEMPTLLLYYKDKPGMISLVTHILANEQINIATLHCNQMQRGLEAFMSITMDSIPSSGALNTIRHIPDIFSAHCIDRLPA
jgi:L-serine dehydratase